ncbi:MAG: helix-turn-helix transcriptional regulator [Gammaproteobacteria bacterium]|nr:helix-turn-helix transcriptional regulator [Gammaproteobacteria bacterium]MYF85740.1 helix-turn-helix transcriptional regulator [Rhodospirillaceae bacterium]MDE0489672.1 helix-turn-helix transcriptional regulator [Gammaproteobacteria bacterium]MXW19949.1 helix-turn-helix transcriptional regulator [Gammaproteobacteria bacterium]MXZ27938.1 helix-turn-helix transcriptional regulator [Gammaproteobacteria bacterium]
MTGIAELHERWSRDADYREAYKRLGPEFEVARALIEARTRAGFTQAELAERMKTTQSAVARMESGRVPPSTRTLEKVAQATGTRLRIRFEQG